MSRLKLGKSCESAALRQKSPVAIEAGSFNFLAQGGFLDAMQSLADRDALAGQRRMIGDDEKAAGPECCKQFAIHLRAVDRHVGRVVVVEQEGNEIEVLRARRHWIVERGDIGD